MPVPVAFTPGATLTFNYTSALGEIKARHVEFLHVYALNSGIFFHCLDLDNASAPRNFNVANIQPWSLDFWHPTPPDSIEPGKNGEEV